MALLANSNHQQLLKDHQCLVGIWAQKLFKDSFPGIYNLQHEARILALAGFLHDVGKASPAFQRFLQQQIKRKNDQDSDFIGEISSKKHTSSFYHEHYSFAACNEILLYSQHGLTRNDKVVIDWLVLHHHEKRPGDWSAPVVKKVMEEYIQENVKSSDAVKILTDHFLEMLALFSEYFPELAVNYSQDIQFQHNTQALPDVSEWMSDNTNKHGIVRLMHSCLCVADRLVSEHLSQQALSDILSKTMPEIEEKVYSYLPKRSLQSYNPIITDDDRSQDQKRMAQELAQYQESVLSAYAGSGKTRTSLLYINEVAKKGESSQAIYVMPKNDQATALYESVVSELKVLGIEWSVQLFLSGEVKRFSSKDAQQPFQADVVITNIDNTLNPQLKHGIIGRILPLCKAIMIFDEFHELLNANSIPALIKHLMHGRNIAKSSTLFMSATPIDLSPVMPFLTHAFNNMVKTSVRYNDNPVNFRIVKFFEEIRMPGDSDGSDISNVHLNIHPTVATTQYYYKNSQIPSSGIFHAKKSPSDKDGQVGIVIENFGKRGTASAAYVHSSPLLVSSFDISFRSISVCAFSPEMLIQAMGRAGRHDNAAISVQVFELYNDKSFESSIKALKIHCYNLSLSRKWYEFLNAKGDGLYTKSEIEGWREEFITQNKYDINQWVYSVFDKSLQTLKQLGSLYSSGKPPKNKKPLATNTKGIRESNNLYAVVTELDNNLNPTGKSVLINTNKGMLDSVCSSITGRFDDYRRDAYNFYSVHGSSIYSGITISLPALTNNPQPSKLIYKARNPEYALYANWNEDENICYISGASPESTIGLVRGDVLRYMRDRVEIQLEDEGDLTDL